MLGPPILPGAMRHPAVAAAAETIQLVHPAVVIIGPPAPQAAAEQ